jgi:DNA-binding NtrC family response regulator
MARVLIVDDEAEAAEIVALFLETRGHEARLATSRHEAVEIGLRYRPDVLITDWLLEDGEGIDVARALSVDRPELRVLVMSGLLPDDVHRATGGGSYAVRMKPVDLDDILRYVAGSAQSGRVP